MFDAATNGNRSGEPSPNIVMGMEAVAKPMLFESVICDLHWSSLHVATISCLMNTCARAEVSWTLRPWRNLLQDNAQIIHLGLRYFPDFNVAPEAIQAIGAFYVRLSELKAASHALISDAGPYRGTQRHELSNQTEQWRELSRLAIAALKLIDPDSRQRLNLLYVENGRILVQFLQEAVDGSTRRVNAWGEIKLPELAQRRQAPRLESRQNCRVIVDGRAVPAQLQDISRQGLGVQCNHEFKDNQILIVEFQDGRRLKGSVVWRKDNRFGLQLNQSLEASDPLLTRRT
jgi:hypothetical protein